MFLAAKRLWHNVFGHEVALMLPRLAPRGSRQAAVCACGEWWYVTFPEAQRRGCG